MLSLLLWPSLAAAASYRVHLAATGVRALDRALAASSNLLALGKSAPVGGFALVTRAQGDVARLQTALESEGYYAGAVAISVDGRDVGDAGLPELLDHQPADEVVPVVIKVKPGPLFHLRRVTLAGAVPADVKDKLLPVAAGYPAVAADILAAQDRLLNALREDGFALATVPAPVATEKTPN